MRIENYDLKNEIMLRKEESALCESVFEIIEENSEFLKKLADSMDEVCGQLYDQAFEFILHCALMEMEIANSAQEEVNDDGENYEV